MSALKQDSIGKRYDYFRVIQLLISASFYELSKPKDRTDKIICSHEVYRCMIKTMPGFKKLMDEQNGDSVLEK